MGISKYKVDGNKKVKFNLTNRTSTGFSVCTLFYR